MHLSEIPQKPLYASVNPTVLPAQRVYFFEKSNGDTFFADEFSAWRIIKGKNQIVGLQTIIPKYLGMSDGTIYQQYQAEAKKIFAEKGLEAAQTHLREGEKKELEKARGNMAMPRNPEIVDLKGNPTNIKI